MTPENWMTLAEKIEQSSPINGLIDACDQVQAKTALAAWAIKQKTNFISAGAAGGKQQAELVQIDDLSATTHDPLLSKMRYNLRRVHGAPRIGRMGVVCLYSQEPVQQPLAASDGSLNCHGFGSCVSVTATFGMAAAGWMTKTLANIRKTAL